jgi:predicted metal-dependent phosphoesterase TrpH
MSNLIKADLHIHTVFSHDGHLILENIIKLASKRQIQCVAVTDHNTIRGALALKDLAPSWLSVIVGEEISTNRGEVTGLFLEERVPPDMSPVETVAAIKEQGGLVLVPHPLDRVRGASLGLDRVMSLLSSIDIVEVWNSRNAFADDNVAAEELADRFNLLKAAGSDAHRDFEFGNSFVEMPMFMTKDEFVHSLSCGQIGGKASVPLGLNPADYR